MKCLNVLDHTVGSITQRASSHNHFKLAIFSNGGISANENKDDCITAGIGAKIAKLAQLTSLTAALHYYLARW